MSNQPEHNRGIRLHTKTSKDHHLQCILTTYAHDEAENFSKAAPILLQDFYVDDCISGAETLEEALEIQSRLQDLLNSGRFTLRKWCSNSTEVLATIPPKLQETQHALTDGDSVIVRTLGLSWRPSFDQFQITSGNTSHLIAAGGLITKRFILSKILDGP
jgi:translation initiation factor IF-1